MDFWEVLKCHLAFACYIYMNSSSIACTDDHEWRDLPVVFLYRRTIAAYFFVSLFLAIYHDGMQIQRLTSLLLT